MKFWKKQQIKLLKITNNMNNNNNLKDNKAWKLKVIKSIQINNSKLRKNKKINKKSENP